LSDHFGWRLKLEPQKALLAGKIQVADLTDHDFEIETHQKGVDMKIGVDIASLAFKRQVDQIILVAGDGDFVSAAKLARREGIDFVLDPMWAAIPNDLHEHIDGLKSVWPKPKPRNAPINQPTAPLPEAIAAPEQPRPRTEDHCESTDGFGGNDRPRPRTEDH
jgi:hypothetical protein